MTTTPDRSLRATLRQLRYPRALRIAPRSAPIGTGGEEPHDLDVGALAEVATGLWRARRRMLAPGSNAPSPAFVQPFRHLESTWAALERAGVTIQDHDGARYLPGLALQVLAFEESTDVTSEEVVRTIRPSVYVGDRTIQQGEVIVGRPPQEVEEPAPPDPVPEEGHPA